MPKLTPKQKAFIQNYQKPIAFSNEEWRSNESSSIIKKIQNEVGKCFETNPDPIIPELFIEDFSFRFLKNKKLVIERYGEEAINDLVNKVVLVTKKLELLAQKNFGKTLSNKNQYFKARKYIISDFDINEPLTRDSSYWPFICDYINLSIRGEMSDFAYLISFICHEYAHFICKTTNIVDEYRLRVFNGLSLSKSAFSTFFNEGMTEIVSAFLYEDISEYFPELQYSQYKFSTDYLKSHKWVKKLLTGNHKAYFPNQESLDDLSIKTKKSDFKYKKQSKILTAIEKYLQSDVQGVFDLLFRGFTNEEIKFFSENLKDKNPDDYWIVKTGKTKRTIIRKSSKDVMNFFKGKK